MIQNLEKKQNLLFYGIGILLALILLSILIYSINFLINQGARAFNPGLIKEEETANFNLNDIEKIKPLLKK